ncbi:MAG TPA: hypothetical protein VN257_11610, partial [Actinotalea sp.]|nr:hypothetical protein [Actinotalea sp.]
DLFSFAQITIVFFILVGASGALWRHASATGAPLPSAGERIRIGEPVEPAEAVPARASSGPFREWVKAPHV